MSTKDKILNIIKITSFIVIVISSIILLVMLIQKLTDHSPSELTIIMWIAGIIFAYMFLITSLLVKIKGDVGGLKEFRRQNIEFQKHTISKINEISRDVKEIKNKINSKSVR